MVGIHRAAACASELPASPAGREDTGLIPVQDGVVDIGEGGEQVVDALVDKNRRSVGEGAEAVGGGDRPFGIERGFVVAAGRGAVDVDHEPVKGEVVVAVLETGDV